MDYRKRLMILQRASESTGRRWSVLERDEEPELINIRDITQQKDDSDTEDYVSQVLMGALLENFLFKLLIIVMIVSNCIIMAFQTDAIIAKKYDIAFSICEHIILTVFIWEILVKWYYGFNIFWKVFAVFGVTLFSAAVPSAFGDLFSALYTLFICITQDGWMDIYREFKADEGLMYGASLYFFIFLTGGAFIFANLLVAVVTTNLEISMPDYDEKNSNECSLAALIPEDTGGLADQSTIHVEEVVTKSNMTRRQKPWKASCLENLTMDTFEELALVMAAMQKNMAAYREIRQELDSIVEEVHSLSFNVKQEQEVMMRNHMAATLQDNLLNNDIATGRTGDILSTLITLEKAHVIDSNTASAHLFQKGNMRHAAMRLSMDSQMYYQSTSTHMDAGHSNTPSTHHNTG
uniref:Ion transport domain-containing protein n=1 Tax=Hucho hucho TaxID=62062 RepID=A0A4W5L765_9TELE